jgi:hydroxypyruvate reductase
MSRETLILATRALPPAIADALARDHDLQSFEPGASHAGRVLITDPGRGATAAMMDAMPDLALVAVYGVGTDAVDLAHAAGRGIAVSNTPGLLTDAVADLALALLLSSARAIPAADAYVRGGGWTTLVAALPLGQGLNGRRLGIVGLGAIGAGVARRALGFGMDIAWHGPRDKDVLWPRQKDLLALARDSDVLVLTCPATDATRGLIGADVLAALGRRGTLVNVARGSVVDQPALIAALESGALGFAALDVFADEPHVPPQLRALPNVILTPHQGSATQEARASMGHLLIDNVTALLGGRPLPTPVALPA